MSGPWQKFQNPSAGEDGPWSKFRGATGGNNPEQGGAPTGEEPSWVEKAYNWFTKPNISGGDLINKVVGAVKSHVPGVPAIGEGDQPHYAADTDPGKALKTYATSGPTMAESAHPKLTGAAKGLAHAVTDTADVAGAATSPAGIVGTASGLGTEIPAVAGASKALTLGQSLGWGGKGAYDLADSPELYANEGDDVTAPNPDSLQQKLNAAAMFTGGATGAAAGTKGAAPKLASKIMNSVLDTNPDVLRYTNPGEEVVKHGIYGNSKQGLMDKVGVAKNEVGSQVDPLAHYATNRGVTSDVTGDLQPIRDTEARAAKESQLGTANKAKDFYSEKVHYANQNPTTGEYEQGAPRPLTNMTPDELLTFKRGMGRGNWDAASPDFHTLEAGRRGTYGNLKDTLHTAVPELKPYDERFSGLKEAEESLEPQVRSLSSEFTRGPSDYVAGATAGGLLGLGATHNAMDIPQWAAYGLGGMALKRALASTPVASRAAYWLGNQEPLAPPTVTPAPPPAQPGAMPQPAPGQLPGNTAAPLGLPPNRNMPPAGPWAGPGQMLPEPGNINTPPYKAPIAPPPPVQRPQLGTGVLEGEYLPQPEPSGPPQLTGRPSVPPPTEAPPPPPQLWGVGRSDIQGPRQAGTDFRPRATPFDPRPPIVTHPMDMQNTLLSKIAGEQHASMVPKGQQAHEVAGKVADNMREQGQKLTERVKNGPELSRPKEGASVPAKSGGYDPNHPQNKIQNELDYHMNDRLGSVIDAKGKGSRAAQKLYDDLDEMVTDNTGSLTQQHVDHVKNAVDEFLNKHKLTDKVKPKGKK